MLQTAALGSFCRQISVKTKPQETHKPFLAAPMGQSNKPPCCTQLEPAAGRCEEGTSQDLAEWSSLSQQQHSFSSKGRRFEMRAACLPAQRKGCQTTSIPSLQVSCIPAKTTQIQYPKVLIFTGKCELFTCSVAHPHPSARTKGHVLKSSQVVAVGCRVARLYSCPKSELRNGTSML